MNMDDKWFIDGQLTQTTSDEERLIDKIYDFENLFDDMLFKEDSITYELLKCQSKQQDSNIWTDDRHRGKRCVKRYKRRPLW